jgi:hypothetical protein
MAKKSKRDENIKKNLEQIHAMMRGEEPPLKPIEEMSIGELAGPCPDCEVARLDNGDCPECGAVATNWMVEDGIKRIKQERGIE